MHAIGIFGMGDGFCIEEAATLRRGQIMVGRRELAVSVMIRPAFAIAQVRGPRSSHSAAMSRL